MNIFQRANTIETQLNNLFQRINDIQRIKTKLIDSHINIDRKLKQINNLTSTTNTDENQERLILIQVNNQNKNINKNNLFRISLQTVLEILNENDVHLREFADMIDHLQPQISEFLIEFEQIKTNQEQLNYEAKVRYK